MQDRKANYEIVFDSTDLLRIRDLGPWDEFMTVTNAAETVVEELSDKLGNRRLEYFDSEGELTEIRIVDGRFASFAPVLTEK